MRRSLTICGILSVTAWSALPASAADRLEMPYSCTTRANEVVLKAGAPQLYEILGNKEQRTYTACREAGSPNCKTMTIYRFAISCGGKSVSWVEIAAKIRSETIGASWLEADQLNLLIRTNKGNAQRTARFIIPRGYAPIEEVGARLNSHDDLSDIAQNLVDHPTVPNPVSVPPDAIAADAADAAIAAAADMAARSAASSAILVADTALISEEAWQTVVYEHDVGAAVSPAAGGLVYAYTLGALALTLLAAMFGFLGRHRWRTPFSFARLRTVIGGSATRSWWRSKLSAKLPRTDNQTFFNGVDSVAALLLQVESLVYSLKSAGPLRDTLSGELKGIRQRLASLKQADRGELSEARTSAGLRAIVRDLERIRRIADSAAISMSKGARVGRGAVPKTAAEAYELLGINASVSEATLKKIVDGLRMSWHPDLARDAADRDLREERTKCINIAWDLITGKRAA